jgi:hypothetical protein
VRREVVILLKKPENERTIWEYFVLIAHEIVIIVLLGAFVVIASGILKGVLLWLEMIHGTTFPPIVDAVLLWCETIVYLALVLLCVILHLTHFGEKVRKNVREWQEGNAKAHEEHEARNAVLQSTTQVKEDEGQ